VDVATFVVSLLAVAAIRSMPAPEGASTPSFRTIIEGLLYARRRPELIGTYVVDMTAMTFAMPMALFPAMASAWGASSRAGWLFAAISAGSLLTSVLSGWAARVRRHGAAVVVAAAVWGLAIVGFGFSPQFSGALACLVVAGAADAVSGLFRMTIWNETIPTELRGRLAGVEMISYLSGPLLGNARAGWIASISSNTISVVSGGLICIVGVLFCIPVLPRFWVYRTAAKTDGVPSDHPL
jgi:MFS family permease